MTESSEPNPHLTVGDRKFFMSFGLLNDCLVVINDIPGVAAMGVDAQLREGVLRAVLATRDEEGNITNNPAAEVRKLSATEALSIIEWVTGHALDFFLAAVERAVTATAPYKDRLEKALPPLPTGSET